jgi:hypothetical protein
MLTHLGVVLHLSLVGGLVIHDMMTWVASEVASVVMRRLIVHFIHYPPYIWVMKGVIDSYNAGAGA